MIMNRVKELRKSNGYSQQKLAEILKVHQTAISQWETGRTSPDIDTARDMAELFNVSLEYLLGYSSSYNKADNNNDPTVINASEGIAEGIPGNSFNIDFPNRLKEARCSAGYSQKSLASKLYISQQAYAQYETGKASPNPETMKRLSEVLDVSTDYLVGIVARKTITCSRLKELRSFHGIKQRDIAELLGIDRTTYGKYETGASEPDFNTIERIADFYNVTVDYLFGRSNGVNNVFSIRLKMLRKEHDITQEELANSIGVSRSAVSMWEIAASQPDNDLLLKISQVLNVSIDYLLGRTDDMYYSESDPTWINVLGRVAAGIPIEAIEEVIDREQITEEMARNGKYIALQIHGASMEPRMKEGDVVIVRLQDDCDSGDTVIAMINGDDATCKIIKKMPEGIMLISTNPSYDPMFYSNSDIEELPVRILGKVVELRAKY